MAGRIDLGSRSDSRQRIMFQKLSAGLGITFQDGLVFNPDDGTAAIDLGTDPGLEITVDGLEVKLDPSPGSGLSSGLQKAADGLAIDLRDTDPCLELAASGVGVTVAADNGLQTTSTGLALVSQSGTAFPTTGLFVGRQFFRTDLIEWYTYTGTQWVGELYAVSMGRNTAAVFPIGTVPIFGPAATTIAQPHGIPNLVDRKLCGYEFKSDQAVSGDLEIYLGTTLLNSETLTAVEGDQQDLNIDLDASTTDGINARFVLTSGTFEDVVLVLFLRRRFDP